MTGEKTDENKLERMIEFLTESHLDVFGGYPYDYEWVDDTLIVAALDDAKERHRTLIGKYNREELIDWYDRAVDMFETENETFETALWETNERGNK